MNEGMNERKVRHRDTLVYWNTLMATIAPCCSLHRSVASSSLCTHWCIRLILTRLSRMLNGLSEYEILEFPKSIFESSKLSLFLTFCYLNDAITRLSKILPFRLPKWNVKNCERGTIIQVTSELIVQPKRIRFLKKKISRKHKIKFSLFEGETTDWTINLAVYYLVVYRYKNSF